MTVNHINRFKLFVIIERLIFVIIERSAPSTSASPVNSPSIKQIVFRPLHVSPFLPETTPESIIDHLNKYDFIRDFLGDIKCTKLVSQKRSLTSLHFVSFKLDIPQQHFEIVADSNIWPVDIEVKEFELRTCKNNAFTNSFKMQKNERSFAPTNRLRHKLSPKGNVRQPTGRTNIRLHCQKSQTTQNSRLRPPFNQTHVNPFRKSDTRANQSPNQNQMRR